MSEPGAGDGIRTRDSELGKLVLYQLSYARSDRRRFYNSRICCKYALLPLTVAEVFMCLYRDPHPALRATFSRGEKGGARGCTMTGIYLK